MNYAVPLQELIGISSPVIIVACLRKRIKYFLTMTEPMSSWLVCEYRNAKWFTIGHPVAPNIVLKDLVIIKGDYHGLKNLQDFFLKKGS